LIRWSTIASTVSSSPLLIVFTSQPGIPYFHSSFPKLGVPAWFGYFIGTCELLGSIALFIRPLSALAALGLLVIMIGATYYHATFTPIVQAAPAFVLSLLCVYIFARRRSQAAGALG
jgi:putative oxidoreductase